MQLANRQRDSHLKARPFSIFAKIPTSQKAVLYAVCGLLLTMGGFSLYASRSSDESSPKAHKILPISVAGPELKASTETPMPSPAGTDKSSSTTTLSQETSLEVNGQTIAVPDNGELHQTIKQVGGQTTVDVSTSSNGASNSTNISVHSFTSSD